MPNNKKQIILKAAEEIMVEKGLNDSTIAEIALKAGVTDSVIYHYYKNKEDLLFSIPAERMKDYLNKLNEHLEGIEDPVSKLRKTIWFHLHHNDNHLGYAHLLFFECRSNRNFYLHEAYKLIRQYTGILRTILQDGVREMVFRVDLDIPVTRDMILGALDGVTISCYAAQEARQTVRDFEKILALILPAITFKLSPKSVELDKSTRIIMAAEKGFAEKGYNQSTIEEISKLAKVAEGTVYEYFKNKEDLLFSISKKRFQENIYALAEIFEIKSPIKKLQQFGKNYFSSFLTQSHFLKVFLFNTQFNRNFYSSEAYNLFQKYIDIIDSILEEGKKDGSIRTDVNNEIFKNLFVGSFTDMALRWEILEDSKTDRIREMNELLLLMTMAVAAN